MELLQLKYFCDAAQTQNFSKTAKKFLVPPSNISQTIKRLEKELHTPLFERCANKIKLNDEGLLFYKNAKVALELLDNAKNLLTKQEKKETIKINIHICRRIVMAVIDNFRKIYPELSFVTAHSTDEICDEFDIIVTDRQLDLPYSKTMVAEEKFLLAYNKNKFVLGDNITSFELENLPFITMGKGSSIYEHTLNICNRLGFNPHIALQSEDPSYIRKCVELGLGIAIIPELSWRGQFSKEIALKNIGENGRKIYLYKKHSMNKYINEYSAMLIENFSS